MFNCLPNAYGDAATNMAIDSALMETLPPGTAALRHYAWTEPSVTFGYSQRYRDVAASIAPDGITLCRRPSGGGIVDHRNDWTYACIIHRQTACTEAPATELYATLHQALANTLRNLGQSTRLAPCPKKCGEQPSHASGPNNCFTRPVMNDLLTPDGRKIAGAAMKRSRRALLIQGSVNRDALPPVFDFSNLTKNFADQLAPALKLEIRQPDDLRPYFNGQQIEQAKRKFADVNWTKRR
ncbi:MAG: biotin/lipoate A/B protein ligase family protein [Opitutales bacterium]